MQKAHADMDFNEDEAARWESAQFFFDAVQGMTPARVWQEINSYLRDLCLPMAHSDQAKQAASKEDTDARP